MAGLFEGAGGEALAAEFGIPFLGRVPFDSGLATAADVGVPFVMEHADAPAGRALLEIADRLRTALG
jgi:ATP-binding protein involved in chromosome partitioning